MPVDVVVPSVGESITEVFIGTWLKKQGDAVTKDEPLVEIETDKATLEVPAEVSGVLSEVLKAEGEGAAVGDTIARIQEGASAPAGPKDSQTTAPTATPAAAPTATPAAAPTATPAAAPTATPTAAPAETPGAPTTPAGGPSVPAQAATSTESRSGPATAPATAPATSPGAGNGSSAGAGAANSAAAATPPGTAAAGQAGALMPAAQRLLDENNLSVEEVVATGPGGRILKEDVLRAMAERERRAAEDQVANTSTVAYERQEEVVPMTPLRRRIAERLVEAQHTAALLTTFNEVDLSAVIGLRKEYRESFEARHGVRLGFMSFFVKAVIEALKEFPQLNAEVRDQSIVYKNYYDIGVAVSTKRGLIVPVVRDAERLSFAEVEKAIADFGARAASNRIMPDELSGGTFTISNGGVFGSLMSTPIVNPPQSGVLGMHTIQERPVAENGAVVIRPMMYIALTYDHRVVDGREAVTFLKRVKDGVERPTRLLLEV